MLLFHCTFCTLTLTASNQFWMFQLVLSSAVNGIIIMSQPSSKHIFTGLELLHTLPSAMCSLTESWMATSDLTISHHLSPDLQWMMIIIDFASSVMINYSFHLQPKMPGLAIKWASHGSPILWNALPDNAAKASSLLFKQDLRMHLFRISLKWQLLKYPLLYRLPCPCHYKNCLDDNQHWTNGAEMSRMLWYADINSELARY